ncbi:hypothetical protein Acr_06g0016990 [Actinidia rufa]|uniref:Retrovirus-related Pol polyprotein from transposon TNT 1-94-like beta-barrel domain-containing protein n=1 Tax=Actinidia rufa TaxID=165716 RepID=A0A7J0EUV9_9ERIC|nr:hypothetical protein Acr_06g0016990 [Actinidia rufa]
MWVGWFDVVGHGIQVETVATVESRGHGGGTGRAPAPNRVGNGVWTGPHAPFEDRRVRSVSVTRPRRSHAQPRARGRTHAPARAKERLPRAATRPGRVQSSDTAVTAVMAVDESEVLLAASEDGKLDWVLDSSSAYHLCRDREVFSTYAACEGRIWMANNTASRVVGRGSVQFRMADGRFVTLTEWRNSQSFPRETRRCCRERRLEGYTDWRGMSRQGELLSDIGPVVLARRMDKGSNRCTEVRKASAGVLRGSVMVPGGSGVRSSEEGDQVDFEKLYSEGRGDAEASLFCSRFDQWWCSLQLCAQGRRDGATTTHKVTYFAAHSSGGCGASQWGDAGHLGEKVQGTSVWRCIHFGGKWSSPLMRLGISDAVLQSYGGAGSEVVRKDNLKTSDYPPVGWRGRLLSPAHLDESKPTWMSPSPVAKPKPDWSSYGVSM